MAGPPPPPPPPHFARRGRSGSAWIQRPRPPMMGGNRFMENTSELDVMQGQTTGGLVNQGTGVFHPRFPIFYNYRATYTLFHPRVPFVRNNGANCNKNTKGKKKKQGTEAAPQISTSRNASNGNNAGGLVESQEPEPSSEIELPEEWTY